eukprot:3107324-Rhodomonas_salina.1
MFGDDFHSGFGFWFLPSRNPTRVKIREKTFQVKPKTPRKDSEVINTTRRFRLVCAGRRLRGASRRVAVGRFKAARQWPTRWNASAAAKAGQIRTSLGSGLTTFQTFSIRFANTHSRFKRNTQS